MKTTPAICAIALISTLLPSLVFSQEPSSQGPNLPLEREITDATGRKLNGTITAKSETGLKFRRTSDGKEFDIPLDKLSVADRIFLGIDPPDALDTQRFPFRIHAPLRRHGKQHGGTTTIEPGEPVEMVAQDGKTITILHAGQELEFQIPDNGGETTALPVTKSRWTPVFPDMDPKQFLAAVNIDRDGPDPVSMKILREATEPGETTREIAVGTWYGARKIPVPNKHSIIHIFSGLTPQTGPGEANTLIKEAQPTRAKILPAQLIEDPVAAVGCLYVDYRFKAKKKSLVSLDTYQKGIEETKAEIGWKTKLHLSLPELVKSYIKILPDPGSSSAPAFIFSLDGLQLAPLFPFEKQNEIIIEKIKSDIRKQKQPVLISTIRWEGKAANGKDTGKPHVTIGLGYKSDGTITGTSLQCLDGDGVIRDYPAEDVYSAWLIGFTFKEDIISQRNPNTVDPNNHVSSRPGDKRESLPVGSTDTVLITTSTGAAAMIQFTKMEAETSTGNSKSTSASYRWKYRPASGQPVQSGNGELKNSYTITPIPDKPNRITRNPDHNEIVKAGEITLSWYGSEKQSYLNYYPSRGTAKIIPREDFEKQF